MVMEDFTRYQQGIIKNYYRNKQGMALQKLQELASDLYLAGSDKERDKLWKRVEKALIDLEVPPRLMEHIVSKRSLETLINNLKEWWAGSLPAKTKRPPGADGAR